MRQKPVAKEKALERYPDYPYVKMPILMLFCSYVIIWYLQLGTRRAGLGAIRIELIFACLLTPLILITESRDKKSRENPLTILIILYFLLMLVMTFFSYDVQISWNIFYNRVFKFGFMALFIVSFIKSPKGVAIFSCCFHAGMHENGAGGHGRSTDRRTGLAGSRSDAIAWFYWVI